MDGKRDIKMSIIRNDAGEVRLAWRLILVIVLFVAVAVLLRFIPIRLLTASLVRDGMAQGDAVETANTIIGEDAVWSTAIGALSGLMGLLIVWFLIRALERSEFTWRAVGLDWRSNSFLVILLGAMLAVLLYSASVLAGYVLSSSGSSLSTSTMGAGIPIFIQKLVAFLAMGFGEEIVFRGYAQARLVKRFGAIWGVLATAAIFTLLHQISYRLSPVTILSGVMLWTTIGALYHFSKSLHLVVMFHGLMNTLLNTFLFDVGDIASMIANALALSLVILVALIRRRKTMKLRAFNLILLLSIVLGIAACGATPAPTETVMATDPVLLSNPGVGG